MCLWAIYIFPRSVSIFCWRKYVDRSWDYINCSRTHECWNWGWGRAIPRKGIYKGDFRCSVYLPLRNMEQSAICYLRINHNPQIFLTRPSVWSCERHGCHPLEKIPAGLSDAGYAETERPYSFCPRRTPALYLLYKRAVWQKFPTPGISELSVQNIRDSGEMLSKDRSKTTSGFFVIPILSQLWEEKNYCERRNELSSWRPVTLTNCHIHLCLFKLGYDVYALLSSVMYILSPSYSMGAIERMWPLPCLAC